MHALVVNNIFFKKKHHAEVFFNFLVLCGLTRNHSGMELIYFA